jgi:hypothetical protein
VAHSEARTREAGGRAGGRWRGVVNLGWLDGKRRRKYITCGTQAEVVRELRRLTATGYAGTVSLTAVDRCSGNAATGVRYAAG